MKIKEAAVQDAARLEAERVALADIRMGRSVEQRLARLEAAVLRLDRALSGEAPSIITDLRRAIDRERSSRMFGPFHEERSW